jgi:transposase
MKFAPSVLPETPPNGLTCGIDWASEDHAVSIVDVAGREIERFKIIHTDAGLSGLTYQLQARGVAEVAIERADGPVVDTLLAAGLTVVVISPNQLKNLRSRYGSAGSKDDRFDAFVLADTLRTDRSRLRPLTPDSQATITLRNSCRTRKDLVAHRVAMANQLRAHLGRVFPAAIGLFADIDSPISLAFLTRFDSQDAADWLSPRRFAAWLSKVGYSGKVDPQVLHQRLTRAPRGLSGTHASAEAQTTQALVAVLTSLVTQIKTLTNQIDDQLSRHADQHIFTSLPRAGRVRAARLLAEIGDCRAKFPTPEALTGLAGVTPVTRQSGKIRTISYRWAADKQLRDAVCDFAAGSRQANPWAAHLYRQARARGHDHPHAVRILARAWLHVIWQCWQTNTAYDTAQHGGLQRILNQDQLAA